VRARGITNSAVQHRDLVKMPSSIVDNNCDRASKGRRPRVALEPRQWPGFYRSDCPDGASANSVRRSGRLPSEWSQKETIRVDDRPREQRVRPRMPSSVLPLLMSPIAC